MTVHEYDSVRTKGRISEKVKGAWGSRTGMHAHRDGLTWILALKEHERAPIRKEEGKVITTTPAQNVNTGCEKRKSLDSWRELCQFFPRYKELLQRLSPLKP